MTRILSAAPNVAALLGLAAIVAAQFAAAVWYGGVSAQSQFCLSALIMIGAALIWVYGFVAGSGAKGSPLLVWILLLGVALGFLQSWPSEIAMSVAPTHASMKQELMVDSDQPSPARWQTLPTISFNPYATRRDTAALAVLAMVVLASSVGIRTRWSPLVVLLLPALLGSGLAIYGLSIQISGDPAVAQNRPLLSQSFATFVNPNHAGGYFNLCLGAALGVAWWAFANKAENLKLSSARNTMERWQRLQMRIRWEIATLNARKFAALALVSLCAAASICTLSRGAIVALIGGTLFTVLIVVLGRRSVAGVLAGIAVLATGIGLTAWVGMTEQVSAELATLSDQDAATGRLVLWSSVLPIAARYGLWGTGLGTFRYAYRPAMEEVDRVWFYHAENQYVEALMDGGWLGLTLLLAALMIAVWQVWRLVRCTGSRRFLAIGIAAMFGLITQAIQATCDFGLYLPSNSWLLALLVGAAIGSRAAHRSVSTETREKSESKTDEPAAANRFQLVSSLLPASARAAILWALVVGGVSWGLVDHYRASQLERAIAKVDVDLDEQLVEPDVLDSWIDELRDASVNTGSAEGWARLADLYEARFRSQWLSTTMPENALDEDRQAAWPLVSLVEFHRRAAIARRADSEQGLEALFVSVGGSHPLMQADDALRRARRACPLIAGVHLQLAQTCVTWEEVGADARHLGRALKMAPNKTEFLALAGLLDLHEERLELCHERWRRAIELDPGNQVGLVTRLALDVFPVASVAAEVIPTKPAIQLDIAKRLDANDLRSRELKQLLLQSARESLSQSTRTPEDAVVLARIQRELGAIDESILSFEEALAAHPYEKQWRLELVEGLVSKQEWERAQTEINRVLLLDNDWAAALRLRDSIRTALIREETSLPLD